MHRIKSFKTSEISVLEFSPRVRTSYTGDFFALFILCKEAKKISKSLQRSEEIAKEEKMKILTVFEHKLKDLIMYFSFQWSTEKKLDKNSCFVNFPQVLL